MDNRIWINFIVLWGIWILIPLLVDGTIAIRQIIFSWKVLFKRKSVENNQETKLDFYPAVSIIVPIHNSAGTLCKCLESLALQSYPIERMDVVLVDNGSTDNSFNVYKNFTDVHSLLRVRWIRINEPGKSKALNSGVFLGSSEIMINIDSDTQLDKNVIIETVKAFIADEGIAGATGAVMINHKLITKESTLMNIVQNCELFEYLQAFYIGRKYQAASNSLFTIAGAYSSFRKRFLLRTFLYDQGSLAEDTKLTFELRKHNQGKAVEFIENAKIYVEPIPNLTKLYAQRVRWQQGELDVISSYAENYKSFFGLFKSSTTRLLFIDHTLIFPRVVWTVLVPFLLLLGYPLYLIVFANVLIYIVYFILDLNFLLVTMFYVDKDYKNYIVDNLWKIGFLPLYRFFVFWLRVAGAIQAVTGDKMVWTVKNPFQETAEALRNIRNKF